MKSKDVQLGGIYVVKVSGKLTRVRLDSESPYGGWNGTNLETKRDVRIKTAAKLRCEVMPANTTPDFYVENHGSIILLRPVSSAAKEWIDEHIPEDAQYFGNAVVVEPRYIADIVQGIQNDGLAVQS